MDGCPLHTITAASGERTQLSYNPLGDLIRVQDPQGRQLNFIYGKARAGLTYARYARYRSKDNRRAVISTDSIREHHVPSSIKSAGVYLRRGIFYAHPLAGSQGGDPCLFIGPVLHATQDVAAEVLGKIVLQSIEASHHHAAWPSDWKGLTDPLLDAAGVKSMATFMKGCTYVRVDTDRGELAVTPSTSKEHRNAFAPLLDRQIKRSLGPPEELGEAVIEAMALSD